MHAYPLGATKIASGWNFSVFSETTLLFFILKESSHGKEKRIPLDQKNNKTGSIYHISYTTESNDLYYLWEDNQGERLLDPYAKIIDSGSEFGENNWTKKTVWAKTFIENPFDWEGISNPHILKKDLIIYEMHLRGFTKDNSSGVTSPGTIQGYKEKIPYLKELGITAVELLPIFEFNESEYTKKDLKGNTLCNYWGYSSLSFFSPMMRFSSKSDPNEAITEYKELIKELHRAGIAVILDVVYNHTGEGNEHGPILSFKGFSDETYYIKNAFHYANYSGCGNTCNCNNPICGDLILESMRYWVTEFKIDGFRLDLAAILARGMHGELLDPSPIFQRMSFDPLLRNTLLIAEPWDACGLHLTAHYFTKKKHPVTEWMEWNDDWRNTVRYFIKGTPGYAGKFASKMAGSEDQFHTGSPLSSINYVTSHDGFSLYDLVSYQQKHNLENGEENRDGMPTHDSWNCGYEGPVGALRIKTLRLRQIKNFFMALFLSQGTPMMLMGDEYAHTRKGNNNAWCQDNEKNWFQWDTLKENKDMYDFCRFLIDFRKNHAILKRCAFLTKDEVSWHGRELNKPDWGDGSQCVAYTLHDLHKGHDLFIAFNASPNNIKIELPKVEKRIWICLIDTFMTPSIQKTRLATDNYVLHPYSSLFLQQYPSSV